MSVWSSPEDLVAFVRGQAGHVGALRRRHEWFERAERPMVVLWWVDDGHRPTLAEAVERLEHLRANGPTWLASLPAPRAGHGRDSRVARLGHPRPIQLRDGHRDQTDQGRRIEAYARATDAAFSGVASPRSSRTTRSVAELDRRFAALREARSSPAGVGRLVPHDRARRAHGADHRHRALGVLPTHRRRGVNTALMRAQLEDAHRRGSRSPRSTHRRAGSTGVRLRDGHYLADLDVETSHSAFHAGYVPSGRVGCSARDEAMPRGCA